MRKKITTIMLAAALPMLACAQPSAADTTQAARQDSVYKRVQLGGVTVEGRTAIQKDDHTNYMPTRRQAEATSSGIGLLARMMIPKLIVNMADRSVKNADNAELSIYIDNRKADRLRPKDIVRVEHYDRPTAMFPDEQTVLNFITRKYDRGGYVDARTSTTPYPDFGKGDYSAQLGLDTKKLNVTLMAGAAYSRDESAGTRGQYGYPAFATPFSKRETPLGGLLKKRTYYGILRTTYRTDKTTAYAEVGLSRDESPAERYRSAVEYSPQVYPAAESATDRDSRGTTPTVKLFVDTKLSESQRLKLTVNYNYHYNAYNRTYAEDGQTAVTMAADEKRNRLDASLQYDISLKHNNALTFFLWGIYNKSHATYHGTMADDQRIGDGDVQFLPIYSHTFWKKLRLGVQPGFYWNVYEIKGYGRTSKIYGRPTVTLNYRASARSSVYASWRMGTTSPSMAMFNTTEQRVNHYTVQRGNPELEMVKLHNINAGYSLSLKNASLSVYGSYTFLNDMFKPMYAMEGETLVNTTVTDGSYQRLYAGASARWLLLDRSLQLSGSAQYDRQWVTGLYARSRSQVFCFAQASYFIKQFTFSGSIASKNMGLCDGVYFVEQPMDYSLSASWHSKGWNLEVMARNLFGGSYTIHSWYATALIALTARQRTSSRGVPLQSGCPTASTSGARRLSAQGSRWRRASRA